MRNCARIVRNLLLSSSMCLAACSAGSKHAASPATGSPSDSKAATASSASPADGSPSPSSPSASAAPSTEAPAAATQKPSRSPRDVLEAKDTVFLLSYDDSAPSKSAEATCTKRAKNDPKKMSLCMAKSRAKIDAEGERFIQDQKGEPWWVVMRRKGKNLVTLHKVRVTFGEETADSIVVKPQGKDKGSKPWKKLPSEIKFEVPSDNRIVVEDPKLGKLVYDAKVGIVGPN